MTKCGQVLLDKKVKEYTIVYMSVEQQLSGVQDGQRTPTRWERQISKILRNSEALELTLDWNANIGSAHEKCTLSDAIKAIKRVDKQAKQKNMQLSPVLRELWTSEILRSKIIKRELKKHSRTLSGIYFSGFSLPELPEHLNSSPSRLTKIAESGFQLPAIEAVSNPNSKERTAEPIGKEVILFSIIDRGF